MVLDNVADAKIGKSGSEWKCGYTPVLPAELSGILTYARIRTPVFG